MMELASPIPKLTMASRHSIGDLNTEAYRPGATRRHRPSIDLEHLAWTVDEEELSLSPRQAVVLAAEGETQTFRKLLDELTVSNRRQRRYTLT